MLFTAPFPSPFVATIYKPRYFTLASLHFFQPVPLPPSSLFLPSLLALTLPFFSPFLPISFSFLEDVDDDAFLDCSHEYRGLQSDVVYSLLGIFCDAYCRRTAQ